MKYKYNIGDTVNIIGEGRGTFNGEIGVISDRWSEESEVPYPYEVDVKDNLIWFREDELELVQKNVNSDKKDLIRNLINKYLSDNETSIREELFLKRFQDYCFEKLGDE